MIPRRSPGSRFQRDGSLLQHESTYAMAAGLEDRPMAQPCMGRRNFLCGLAGTLAGFAGCDMSFAGEARHAIAMHGAPAMPDDFARLRYANPAAPKGGRLVQGVLGTFDSLNPLIVKGLSLPSIRGHVIESLMARGLDEPFTLYGLVAQT